MSQGFSITLALSLLASLIADTFAGNSLFCLITNANSLSIVSSLKFMSRSSLILFLILGFFRLSAHQTPATLY
jgi:hypothetical protein